jgi:uncharacterized protein (TIGR02186 family)
MVVTVSGPRTDMVTRRKERKFGIWVNADSRQFLNVPAYLAVSSNRPIDAIAPADVRRRQQLGIDNVLLTQRVGTDYADVVATDPFRRAFVRLRSEHLRLLLGLLILAVGVRFAIELGIKPDEIYTIRASGGDA